MVSHEIGGLREMAIIGVSVGRSPKLKVQFAWYRRL